MTPLRFTALCTALASASIFAACTTAPPMPMGATADHSMASPEHRAAMQAQMKTMREMHAKMMNAKTADERQTLMAEHHKMMMEHMEMMQTMMDAMAQRTPMPAAKP